MVSVFSPTTNYFAFIVSKSNAPGHQLVGGPRMSPATSQSGSSPSPRPPSSQHGWSSAGGPQMQYGGRSQQSNSQQQWGNSPWGGASMPLTGSGMPSNDNNNNMDPSRFLPWGLTTGSSSQGNSGFDPSRIAGNFM